MHDALYACRVTKFMPAVITRHFKFYPQQQRSTLTCNRKLRNTCVLHVHVYVVLPDGLA